mmetsp:Transcript_24409/g.56264  ORF Transcript_24409/g.56264 Transcript_24409/m.56264 type:complete len:357 (+) Transcript_24409:932-2002(+)
MSVSLQIYMAWAMLVFIPALVLALYVFDEDLSHLQQGIIALGVGGGTEPLPIVAKMAVAADPITWRQGWKAIAKQTALLSLGPIAVVMLIGTFLMDRFWLSQPYHSDLIRQLARPIILASLRWLVCFPVFVEAHNRIESPEFKMRMLPFVHLMFASVNCLAITCSSSWMDFFANAGCDWVLFGRRYYMFGTLYLTEEELRRSWFARKVRGFYISSPEWRLRPLPGMDIKHLRGYECQVESVCLTSGLLALSVSLVVMNLTMSDSFVTNLWFGEEEDRWEKLMYLGVALVMDSAQDVLMRRHVTSKSSVRFTRFYCSPFKSRDSFLRSVNALTAHILMAPALVCMIGIFRGQRGTWD